MLFLWKKFSHPSGTLLIIECLGVYELRWFSHWLRELVRQRPDHLSSLITHLSFLTGPTTAILMLAGPRSSFKQFIHLLPSLAVPLLSSGVISTLSDETGFGFFNRNNLIHLHCSVQSKSLRNTSSYNFRFSVGIQSVKSKDKNDDDLE